MIDRFFKLTELVLRSFFVGLIRFYQYAVSPWLGNNCRFTPSCSNYALVCFKKYGPVKASWKTCLRLCKCHPFHPGGEDLP